MTTDQKTYRSFVSFLLLVTLIPVFSKNVLAQEANTADFQVVQLAANQVYLEWQNEMDLRFQPQAGDTLYVFRDTEFAGTLSIVAVNAPMIVGTFLEAVFPMTRGEIVTGKWNTLGMGQESGEITEEQDEPESLMDRTRPRLERDLQKEPVIISGRIMTGGNLTQSTTHWNSYVNNADTRWSSIPYTNLSLFIRNLPANWNVKIQGRYSYRLQTDSRINQTGMLNMYNFHATKEMKNIPIEIQMGRFYNRYETSYSYWDGLMIHYKQDNWGTGASAGWEPESSNEGIQTAFPKVSGFVHHELRRDDLRWFGQISATNIFPADYENHYYAGIEQRFDYKALTLDGELRIDQDLASNSAQLTKLQLRADIEITQWLEIRAIYNERTPFLLYASSGLFLDSRSRYGISSTIRTGKWWFNNGVTVSEKKPSESITYNSRVQWSQSPVWQISWSIYGSYWSADDGQSWYGGLSASRSFNEFRLSTGASAYRSLLLRSDHLSGSLYVDANANLSGDFSLSARLQTTIGELMTRNSISLSLWKNF